MNYAEIKPFDIANAPYVSCTIFFSGCTHNCKGCFNEIVQNFNYGKKFDNETIEYFIKLSKNTQVKNICILGGEPFQQDLSILEKFLYRLKNEVGKPIWIWSGYTWEEIVEDTEKLNLLKYIDFLVDGRFDVNKKDLTLRFRGSSNQRVIDVKESLRIKQVTEIKIN